MKLNSRGDTIVEVLLAVTVLATVIGGCYAVASRAITQSQQANERTVATKVAESQVEKLKYVAAYEKLTFDDLTGPVTPGVISYPNKCIDSSYTVVARNAATCKNGIYDYYFESYNPDNNQFKVIVEWPPLNSSTSEKVIFYYRVNK